VSASVASSLCGVGGGRKASLALTLTRGVEISVMTVTVQHISDMVRTVLTIIPLLLGLAVPANGFLVMQAQSSVSGLNAPRPKSWSNRQGVTLTPISTGVWAAERPFIWNNIDVGSRSTIARMDDGSLLVHSPVEWDAELGECLVALGGGVGHIIAPNYEHLKYTAQWADQYPEANMYACPGLPLRMPHVKFDHELPDVPETFAESVALRWMDCEVNPFTGKPFFNEVVFFHKKSRSFLCADAFWNYPGQDRPNLSGEGEGTGRVHECPKMPTPASPDGRLPAIQVPTGSKAWKFGMDVIYAPFYRKFMVGDGERRRRYEAAVAEILSWDIEQIVPCHGDVIRKFS